MAHTAIRLGYLSISSGGGGAGFEEYANLAAFPPIGEAETIYLAADTKKIYIWTGSAYEEISSSEDKANRDLDNLIETSIPDGVGLNSLATSNFNIKTVDKEGSTANVNISSGDSTVAGNSGDIILTTGEVASGNKGLVKLENNTRLILQDDTGDRVLRLQIANSSSEGYGELFFNRIRSDKSVFIGAMESHVDDDGAPVSFSGTFLLSDTDGQYKTSDVNLQTLSNSGFRDADNVAVSSGNINITTHNSFVQGTETNANTGNISLNTGNPSGSGVRGNISLNGDYITVNSKQIRNLANGTASNDAVNLSQLNSSFQNLKYSQVVYVDKNNTNTYIADGSIDKPYKSIEAMYNAITDASASKRYACMIAPGTYTEASTIRLKGWIDLTNFATDTVIVAVSGGATLKWSNNNPGRVFIKDIGFTSGLEILNDNPTGTSGLVFDLDNVDVPSLIFRGRGGGRDFIQLRNDTRISGNCTIQSAATTIFDSTGIGTLIMNDVGCVAPDSYGSAITASIRSNYIGAIQITATTYDIYTDVWGTIIAGNLNITSNSPSYPCYFNYDATSYPLGTVTLSGSNPAQLVRTSVAQAIKYTPAVSGNWAAPAPVEVKAALDSLAANKINSSEKGAANGIAPLNASTKIDTIYLPSYVDDVVEYVNLAAFPPTGETGKIYVALNTNKIYRWSGSAYIEISPSESATWGSITGTLSSQTDLQEALDDKYDASNPAGYITLAEVPESAVTSVNTRTGDIFLTRVDVGLGDVDNTSDLDKPISTATQTALDNKANKNLDNLTATAIPDGINLESVSTNTSATTGFQVRTKTQTTTNSGSVRIISGDVTGDFTSGGARLWSGDNLNAQKSNSNLTATGLVTMLSGSITSGTGSTGNVALNTGRILGSLSQGNTGPVSIATGNNDGIGNTGDINFTTGEADQGNSGNINFTAGLASGNMGRAFFRVAEIDVDGVKITNLANGTLDGDAVNLSQLNDILDYTPADTSAWIAPVPDDVKEALDQLADRLDSGTGVTIDAFEDMKEPTGFFNRTDSSISLSYNSGTNTVTFSIQPTATSFQVYVKGTKFTKSALESVSVVAPTAGIHYVYYNPAGVLSSTSTFNPSLFEDNALVSLFYWNTDTNTYSYFAEERHGMTMDGATHGYLHTVFGARYLSGLALQNFTIGDGSLNSHAQLTCDSGSIRDEDILLSLSAQTQIPVLFRQGQLWRKKTADAYPVVYSGSAGYTGANGRLPYNQFVGGNWQLTEVDQNKFVLVHYFATNDKETPIVAIQGIAQYNDVPSARNAANTEITTLSGLPFAEFVALGTVVFQTVDSYANDVNARIVPINSANYVDFRGTQLYTPAGEATTHSLLSGLAGDDHLQYHNDARGDLRYNLKSAGDISETSYSITNSQTSAHNITGFSFDNAIVRSFEAEVSVEIDADTDLFEKVSISGIQKSSSWEISIRSLGDVTGVVFSITNAGQLQYTSLNYTGFVSGVIKFRAIITSV